MSKASSSSPLSDAAGGGGVSRDAPLEVLYSADDYYKELGEESSLREAFRVPYDFVDGLFDRSEPQMAPTPLIVFINSRSGGHAGPDLTRGFKRALGVTQVFDLGKHKPDKVLSQIWQNFKVVATHSPEQANHTRQHLRIVAAGGDGTVAWVLQTIARLGLDPPPAVAVVPLGTGNDLSRSFGWGAAYLPKWVKGHLALHRTLRRFADAVEAPLDRWQLQLTAPTAAFFKRKHPYGFVPEGSPEEATKYAAESWNYVSVGMDAKAAHGFHHLREEKPGLAFSRTANQLWYTYFSCTSGWFCGAEPLSRSLSLSVQDAEGGAWRDVEVTDSVRAVVLLNLQSYGGGRDLWGDHDTRAKEHGFQQPSNSDGLIEVVGFKSGYHAGAVMAGAFHAVRLAQAHGVRLRVRASAKATKKHPGMGVAYFQLDGEPWQQDVPAADAPESEALLVELKYMGHSRMLVCPGTSERPNTATASAAAVEADHRSKHNRGSAAAPSSAAATGKDVAQADTGAAGKVHAPAAQRSPAPADTAQPPAATAQPAAGAAAQPAAQAAADTARAAAAPVASVSEVAPESIQMVSEADAASDGVVNAREAYEAVQAQEVRVAEGADAVISSPLVPELSSVDNDLPQTALEPQTWIKMK